VKSRANNGSSLRLPISTTSNAARYAIRDDKQSRISKKFFVSVAPAREFLSRKFPLFKVASHEIVAIGSSMSITARGARDSRQCPRMSPAKLSSEFIEFRSPTDRLSTTRSHATRGERRGNSHAEWISRRRKNRARARARAKETAAESPDRAARCRALSLAIRWFARLDSRASSARSSRRDCQRDARLVARAIHQRRHSSTS